jgi:hypothetical protein
MKSLYTLIPVLLLSACASTHPTREQAGSAPEQSSSSQMPQKVGAAVIAPLNDFNLVQAAIPDVLKEALAAPYAPPADQACVKLAEHIQLLDGALGADLDAPGGVAPSLLERGVEGAENASVSALRNTTEGIVPFRGWIRKLTGAERYSKKVSAAIAAGSVRRAYLKGIGLAKGCEPPAAPRELHAKS